VQISLVSALGLTNGFLEYTLDRGLEVQSAWDRASQVGLTRRDLESLSERLAKKTSILADTQNVNLDTFVLPEEFALFFSWLMSDLHLRSDSYDLNLTVRKAYLEASAKLGISSSEQTLNIVSWIVGVPSLFGGSGYPVALPVSAAEISPDAMLAFEGLMAHAELLLGLKVETRTVNQAEMALTTFLIRITGLVEAIVRPHAGNDEHKAVEMVKAAVKNIQHTLPRQLKRHWSDGKICSNLFGIETRLPTFGSVMKFGHL